METVSPIKLLQIEDIKNNAQKGNPYIIVLLDDWCPASQEYKPIIEFFAEKYEGQIDIHVMRSENIDQIEIIPNYNHINSIPYTFFILGNTILSEVPGAIRFNDFKTAIINLLNFRKP